MKGLAQEAPIVRLVNVLISRALDMRASDIHFEPFERSFQVRCRVDGVLFDLDQPQKTMQSAIVSRLKLMANLNIAERRLPQDGKIKIRFGNREVDIRVSSVPTIYGESVVLRLLAQESVEYDLANLGMDSNDLSYVEDLIERPYGMILVTGPTGSGKTTTLYGVLKRLNTVTRKIITVEDPVEYQINGINQVQVKPQIDLTFANALRSLVRQDPDVLLIGEIRDKETADIAIESALTGHLVLSTLHTNDAPGQSRAFATSASSPSSWPIRFLRSWPSALSACCALTARWNIRRARATGHESAKSCPTCPNPSSFIRTRAATGADTPDIEAGRRFSRSFR